MRYGLERMILVEVSIQPNKMAEWIAAAAYGRCLRMSFPLRCRK